MLWIHYVVRTGCQWRALPHEYPPRSTVHYWFRRWRLDGTRERLNAALREQLRQAVGRHPQPSAAILASQSVKTTGVGGIRGYDGAKELSGRTRHRLVEPQGPVLTATAHGAELQERAAVPLVLPGAHEPLPRLAHRWVDQGYTGTGQGGIEEHPGWTVDVVRQPPPARGRWVPPGDPGDRRTGWFAWEMCRATRYVAQFSTR
jgi:putative transposase